MLARDEARRPRTPRQERATRTVEAILRAASLLLVERGYGATSTNSIAARAGVSVGSLYQYFNDKEDIYRAIVRRHRQQVWPIVEQALANMRSPQVDLVAATLELLHRMAEINRSDPPLLAAIDRDLGWLEHEDDGGRDGAVDVHAVVEAILRERYPHRAPEIDAVATLLLQVVVPLSRWMVHSKPATLDTAHLVAAIGRMLRGLLDVPP